MPPANLDLIKRILVTVSKIMVDIPEILELDLNPVRAFPDRVVVLDAKIICSKKISV